MILSKNPNIIHILENNLKYVCWSYLSKNPNAVHIIEKQLLYCSGSPKFQRVNWEYLSENPNAVHILENNLKYVNPIGLSNNPNPKAISILENNEKYHENIFYWEYFSASPNCISLLEKNQNKIIWRYLSKNPAIFVYDYEKMKEEMKNSGIAEEIAQKVFKPSRLFKLCEQYNMELEELQEIYE